METGRTTIKIIIMKITKQILYAALLAAGSAAFSGCATGSFNATDQINYCISQAGKTLAEAPAATQTPRDIPKGSPHWRYAGIHAWTSGFWPGILWYIYQYTGDNQWKQAADSFSVALKPDAYSRSFDHDLGFMLYNSLGNGYRLTKDTAYKTILLAAADSLATLFNPRVGTILSWPSMVKKMGWPHNTIIDNMMNLELLFWAAKNGGGQRLYHIAVTHAETTMAHQFRPDYSNYHVVVYDTVTGKVIKRVTHQGYSDSSMWARGQAWAIYGFTMVYRETRDPKFLNFAKDVAGIYLKRLPADKVPYWDFDAPHSADEPRDASAAAITASGLLELSTYVKNADSAHRYYQDAVAMLKTLSSAKYQSRDQNDAFLMHSTGSKPDNSEVDIPIIYADYYYLEALLRLDKLQKHQPLFSHSNT
jgi:unsaturated chondroitin disaccharide hydrolase